MRRIGEFAEIHVSPAGAVMTEAEWHGHEDEWLPADADLEYLLSLMEEKTPVPGEYANWIAAPRAGINGQPVGYEYVKIHQT